MVSSDEGNFDYSFKYIIIGDAYVGKSNLLLRYAHGQFKDDYQLTIGVEFAAKNVKIRGKTYRIQIWDTAGQESFRSITRGYYKSSVCALVVYDISNKESFNNISTWIEDCKNQSPKTIFFVLVGNKSDLEDKRQVSTEEGQELAEKYGIPFYETSAKTGTNINEIFFNSAEEIVKKMEQNYYDLEEDCGIKLNINRQNKNKKNTQTGGGLQLGSGKEHSKKKCC